jgi:hypothetical protein
MTWVGTRHKAAEKAYRIAREDGFSPFRALVAGHVASFEDAWIPRKTLAAIIGCSVKTVQRGLNQLRELGRVKIWPAPPTEILKGRTKPLRLWHSHRVYQWGVAVVRQAVAHVTKAVIQPKAPPKPKQMHPRERAAAAGFPDVASWLEAGGPPPKPT